MVKKWLLASLLYFLMAALMGCLLRLYAIGMDSGLVYVHLLHAHSHTAMMGWVYVAIMALNYHYFSRKRGYRLVFGITIGAVGGLMIAFALQGYAFLSILFCSIHLLAGYWLVYKLYRDTHSEKSQALTLMRVALGLLLVSTFGIWGIGPAIALEGKGSEMFKASIQFYLHFQFNGFFTFAVLALLFKTWKVHLPSREFRHFLWIGLSSVVLTFALPLSWSYPAGYWYTIQMAGSILQAYAFVRLGWAMHSRANRNRKKNALLVFGVISLFLKILFPLFLFLPELMQLSYEIRNIAIAYIHLMMLGMISAFLLFIMIRTGMLNGGAKIVRWGTGLFISGFFATELILFFQALQIISGTGAGFFLYETLAIFSFLLPLAILCWLIGFYKNETIQTNFSGAAAGLGAGPDRPKGA